MRALTWFVPGVSSAPIGSVRSKSHVSKDSRYYNRVDVERAEESKASGNYCIGALDVLRLVPTEWSHGASMLDKHNLTRLIWPPLDLCSPVEWTPHAERRVADRKVNGQRQQGH